MLRHPGSFDRRLGWRCGARRRWRDAAVAALAQGKLDARYTATLGGMPLGKGAWVIDIADDQFTAAASGTTAGLLRVFASGQGTGASRGGIVGGQLGAGELCAPASPPTRRPKKSA